MIRQIRNAYAAMMRQMRAEEGKAEEIVRLCKKFHVSKEDTIRELETELSISTQVALDYYDNFTKSQVIM